VSGGNPKKEIPFLKKNNNKVPDLFFFNFSCPRGQRKSFPPAGLSHGNGEAGWDVVCGIQLMGGELTFA